MVPEMSVSHGQSSGLENVRSKHRAQKERSVRVPHRAAATRHPGVLCLSAEVWATSPTLPNKMLRSPVHRKSKVQSDNLMSYPPISSHAVDYVSTPAWNWDSPLTRTPHFCCRHHLGHGLSRVLPLMHPHTCHQALLNRVTACVSHTENTTKFCGCGKSCVHYLAHCCQSTILHCTACCAVLCKLILSLRCVMSGCMVTSRPPCMYYVKIHTNIPQLFCLHSELALREECW